MSLKIPLLNIEGRLVATFLVLGSTVWSAANNIHTICQGGVGINFSSVAVSRPC